MARQLLLFILSLLASLAGAQGQPVPLAKLLGSWQSADGKTIWIFKVDEKNVRLRGGSGLDWRGTYQEGKFHFTVKPTSEAMNWSIPSWARDQVAKQGALTWKLILTATEDKDGPKLDGEILPGEVEWQEISDTNTSDIYKRSARVTGEPGTPIKLAYFKVPNWEIADTLVVSAQPAKPTRTGSPCNYVIFAYGPSLPNVRQEVKSGVLSDSDGVDYTIIGANGDRSVMAGADQQLMNRGWSQATDQLAPKDADFVRKNWGALLIEARVGGNVYPGRYTYRIGGARGGWFLTKGTARATLALWRELPDSPGEPTQYVFPGERVHLKIDVPERALTPWTDEIPLIVSRNGTWMNVGETGSSLTARFDHPASTGSSVFISPTIHLVSEEDPLLPSQRKAAMVGGELVLAVNQDDTVQVGLANPRQFVVDAPGENVNVAADDEGLWLKALRRAAIADGLPHESDKLRQSRGKAVTEVSNFMITQVAFKLRLQYLSPLVRFIQACYGYSDRDMAQGDVVVRNKITLGNHAAALLLRDEFVAQMDPLVAELNAVSLEPDQIAYMEALRASVLNGNSPLAALEVEDPLQDLSAPTNTVKFTLPELYRVAASTPHPEARRSLLAAAFKTYRDTVVSAQKKAVDLADGDIQGLLALTGDCFAPVIKTLTPKLMRPVVDSQGNATWQPDDLARLEVKHLSTTWEALKAQKEWSAIDSDVAIAAVTVTLPLLSEMGPLFKAATAAANLATAAYSTADASYKYFYSDLAKQAFAIGAYRVLGSEPFDMVQAQRTPAWAVVVNLIGLGLVAHGEIPTLMGTMPSGNALARAPTAVAAIKSGGVKAFAELPADTQAAFFDAATAVASKEATQGAAALAKNEQEISGAIKQIQQELRSRHGFDIEHSVGSVPTAETPTIGSVPTAEAPAVSPEAPTLLPERLKIAKAPEGEPVPPILDETQAKTKPSPPETPPQPVKPPEPAPETQPTAGAGDKTAPGYKIKRIGGKTIAEGEVNDVATLRTQGKLPAGFPDVPGYWMTPNGETIVLGNYIAEGQFSVVFEEVGKPSVIKVSKKIGDSAKASWDEMGVAEKVLSDANIPHLKMEFGPRPVGNEAFWVRQVRKPAGAIEPKFGQLLPPNQRSAVDDLIGKLHDAGIAGEDFKPDNIYLVETAPGSGKWEAGILDVDRFCNWRQPTDSIDSILSNFESGFWTLARRGQLECLIPGSATASSSGRLMNFDEFWKFQLQKGGWLGFYDKGFGSRVLSEEEVFARFKWLGNPKERINLQGRRGSSTGGANPPMLLLGAAQRPLVIHFRNPAHENADLHLNSPRRLACHGPDRHHERPDRLHPRAQHQRLALRVPAGHGEGAWDDRLAQRRWLCSDCGRRRHSGARQA